MTAAPVSAGAGGSGARASRVPAGWTGTPAGMATGTTAGTTVGTVTATDTVADPTCSVLAGPRSRALSQRPNQDDWPTRRARLSPTQPTQPNGVSSAYGGACRWRDRL